MNYMVGFAGFTGCLVANFTILYFSRRTVFIGGHFFMMVFLTLIFTFIYAGHIVLILISMIFFIISF